MNTRTIGIISGLLGFLAVLIGAFGAHALKTTLDELGTQNTWETASRYHLLHTLALFAVGAWLNISNPPAAPAPCNSWLRRAAWCWLFGILLFSGSLYWYSLGGPRKAGVIAPIGGLFLMLGWLFVATHAFKLNKSPANTPR